MRTRGFGDFTSLVLKGTVLSLKHVHCPGAEGALWLPCKAGARTSQSSCVSSQLRISCVAQFRESFQMAADQ